MVGISPKDHLKLFVAAQVLFQNRSWLCSQKFPLTDKVLKHAKWIHMQKHSEARWESVEFFLANFKLVSSISGIDTAAVDALFDEFCDYQTMSDHEIDLKAWSEAKVVDGLVNGGCALVAHQCYGSSWVKAKSVSVTL